LFFYLLVVFPLTISYLLLVFSNVPTVYLLVGATALPTEPNPIWQLPKYTNFPDPADSSRPPLPKTGTFWQLCKPTKQNLRHKTHNLFLSPSTLCTLEESVFVLRCNRLRRGHQHQHSSLESSYKSW
jgi:hypothetical protein